MTNPLLDDIDLNDPEIARLAEYLFYIMQIRSFAQTTVANTRRPDETDKSLNLQHRMLELLLLLDANENMSVHDLCHDMRISNRKSVRVAGRILVAKGLIIAHVEPNNSPEGERVLGYSVVESVSDACDDHIEEVRYDLDGEDADAADADLTIGLDNSPLNG